MTLREADAAICVACGTQFPPAPEAPGRCPICEDERQYVPRSGQRWTTMAAMATEHRNTLAQLDEGVTAVRTAPSFAISQHAHVIRTPRGNVLWDCISYLDDDTVASVRELGGLAAIAISHCHFYSSMVPWSRAFGDVPILLHEDNRPWVMRSDASVEYWGGETREVLPGVTLVRCGGHFPGATVLHWAGGADGKGALFTGDTIMVVPDTRWVSFMYSYPNIIPLNASQVRRIIAAVEPFAYDRIYGAWPDRIVERDAKAAVHRSAERYIRHIRG